MQQHEIKSIKEQLSQLERYKKELENQLEDKLQCSKELWQEYITETHNTQIKINQLENQLLWQDTQSQK